jgi:hypothetical protein
LPVTFFSFAACALSAQGEVVGAVKEAKSMGEKG